MFKCVYCVLSVFGGFLSFCCLILFNILVLVFLHFLSGLKKKGTVVL